MKATRFEQSSFRRPLAVAGCAASLLFIAGCATGGDPPTEQMAFAQAALSDAVSAGSAQYAPLELRSAQENLDKANTAAADRNYDAARRHAKAAEADAKLAAITARSTKAQLAVSEVESGIRALRDEIARNGIR